MSDLIDRQAAIDGIDQLYKHIQLISRSKSVPKKEQALLLDVKGTLAQLPSTQPERKKGKWIFGKCDQCGGSAPYWSMSTTYYCSDFCPNCGADMRGEQDETD